jgi:hypothetical protein
MDSIQASNVMYSFGKNNPVMLLHFKKHFVFIYNKKCYMFRPIHYSINITLDGKKNKIFLVIYSFHLFTLVVQKPV